MLGSGTGIRLIKKMLRISSSTFVKMAPQPRACTRTYELSASYNPLSESAALFLAVDQATAPRQTDDYERRPQLGCFLRLKKCRPVTFLRYRIITVTIVGFFQYKSNTQGTCAQALRYFLVRRVLGDSSFLWLGGHTHIAAPLRWRNATCDAVPLTCLPSCIYLSYFNIEKETPNYIIVMIFYLPYNLNARFYTKNIANIV